MSTVTVVLPNQQFLMRSPSPVPLEPHAALLPHSSLSDIESDEDSSTVVGDADLNDLAAFPDPEVAGQEGQNGVTAQFQNYATGSGMVQDQTTVLQRPRINGATDRSSTQEAPERRSSGKKKPREGHGTHHKTMVSGQFKQQQMQIGPPVATQDTVYLYLVPLNNTFTRKCISVPFYPNTMLLGRQMNSRTIPTPENGFFDSRVLSRQHAEIWADRNTGQVWIRDIKSSNGTFINGRRLSSEGEESEPHELKADDVIDLGINISSEDSKTVLHNKVSARVEKIVFGAVNSQSNLGLISQGPSQMHPNGSINLSYSDIDPSANLGNRNLKLSPSGHLSNGNALSMAGATSGPGRAKHRIISRVLASGGASTKGPISLEMVVKRITNEIQFAKTQHSELQRATQIFESIARSQALSVAEADEVAKSTALAVTEMHTQVQHERSHPAVESGGPLPWPGSPSLSSTSPSLSPLLQTTSAAAVATEQKIISLTVSLNALEQELKYANEKVTELESRLDQETYLRHQVESKLALAQQELVLEREQAISDLRSEEEEDAQAAISDATAADTIALMDKEEERQRRQSISSDSELDVDHLIAKLEQARREVQAWESRALAAEHMTEETTRTLERFMKQLRLEQGFPYIGHSPGTSPTRNGTVNRRRSFSRSPNRDSLQWSRRGREQTPSPPLAGTSSIRPEAFKSIRNEFPITDATDDKSSSISKKDGRTLGPLNNNVPRSGANLKVQTAEPPSSSKRSMGLIAPFLSAAGITAVGMGLMTYLNQLSNSRNS
ncbi:hypothetical protein V1525DRAFT_447649 [Lipomyces kononenkoae]|uniref:Uncharacterized protein n=1 Tax=Lipomyces kononenkoae TaxID=34357 RepID=A0ACC3TBW7_LIPKO